MYPPTENSALEQTNQDVSASYPRHHAQRLEEFNRIFSPMDYSNLIIYSGNSRMQFLDDTPYPFKTNPHFKAWVPLLNAEHCYLVLTPGIKPQLYFYHAVDYWHAPARLESNYWSDCFDLHIYHDLANIDSMLPLSKHSAFIAETPPQLLLGKPYQHNPSDLITALHFARTLKTDYEIDCIKAANRIASDAHLAAKRAFLAGKSEFSIHMAYCEACQHCENDLPYGNIVAINENASVLHYQHLNRQPPDPNKLASFLIDAGANFQGYAADITRTYAYQNDSFAQLISQFDALQRDLVAKVRAGVDFKELNETAHLMIAALLKSNDFVTMEAESIVSSGVSSAFFPHGLGHFLGLQVHDVGGFMKDATGEIIPTPDQHPFLRLTRPLQTNNVLTIEPGIYFIDSLLAELHKGKYRSSINWSKVDTYRKYGGIRIEDNILVEADSNTNLTRDAFHQCRSV